ncbi:C_GCAxxG_C_C family protein [Candidatus Thorarchaeota archaeon]|nr:MAG: C_GCAxxG_C_C family protein [Candidatus Thorarchaeota archaeon]
MLIHFSLNTMIDECIKLAKKYFSGKYNCAQSTMKAILTGVDMDFDQIMPLAAGLGAGMAHEGNVCGAVSGAIAALGVIESRSHTDALEQKEAAYASGEEFIRRFKIKHGTIICNKLTGIEMAEIKARKDAMDDGTFVRVCPTFVADAVKIALEISSEKEER